jgi:putative transport protein
VVSLVAQNPVLLLFGVCAAGFLVGRISFGGFSLGVAAVLFVGIGAGAVSATWVLPEEVWVLGLAVFVYTTGLASGPGFVAAIRRRGLPLNAGAVAAVALAAATVAIAVETIHATGGVGSGIFAGAVTSTPALAASIGYLQQHSSPAAFARTGAEPIVGYSLCYPLGVLIPLLSCHAILRRGRSPRRAKLVQQTARIEHVENVTLAELAAELENRVAFGRVLHEGSLQAAEPGILVHRGDLVTVVGSAKDVAAAVSLVGDRISTELSDNRSDLAFRRVLVSNSELAGRRIDELGLNDLHATATRVRRGDSDHVARPDFVLELGDHVRVVAPRGTSSLVNALFGDSYRSLRELDVLTFSLGIAAGLLLGLVPLPLPGGGMFTLGFAGGPLIMGLVLGARERTGRLVWQLPHAANLTLRQFGTVLLLAGIGTKAGQSFSHTVTSPAAVSIVIAGAVVTIVMVAVTVLAGGRLLRLPAAQLAGMMAGVSTQPAVLAYASAHAAEEDEVLVGYATVYPLVMIVKIVAVQLLITTLT